METQMIKTNRSPHMLMWLAGIAIILFCATGVAAMMGWLPTSIGRPSDGPAPTPIEKPSTSPAKPAPAKTHAASEPRSVPVPVASSAAVKVKCTECGVIESTREIDTRGSGSGLGVAGGAVVGGLLGHQVGNGRGKDVATVVGAVGGGLAGNEIEKRMKSTKSYEVTVRLDDGSVRVVAEANPPTWRTGDHVKLVDGAIHSN